MKGLLLQRLGLVALSTLVWTPNTKAGTTEDNIKACRAELQARLASSPLAQERPHLKRVRGSVTQRLQFIIGIGTSRTAVTCRARRGKVLEIVSQPESKPRSAD